jgi:CheY-like chemotaxis protein
MTSLTGLSILLIEDEFLIALDAEQTLRDLGAENVEVISTFEHALETAQQADYDAAVLDVNLNGRLSFPIASAFMRRGVPVVFASGYQLDTLVPEGFDNPIHVSKPYTAEGLREALLRALARQ